MKFSVDIGNLTGFITPLQGLCAGFAKPLRGPFDNGDAGERMRRSFAVLAAKRGAFHGPEIRRVKVFHPALFF
jgi:hypothetical protein